MFNTVFLSTFQGPPLSSEERLRIQQRNDELSNKRASRLAQAREEERILALKAENPAGMMTKQGSKDSASSGNSSYSHVSSRLHDQTEAQIQRLKALAGEVTEEGRGVVPGSFAGQVGVQRRVGSTPAWRQKLCG